MKRVIFQEIDEKSLIEQFTYVGSNEMLLEYLEPWSKGEWFFPQLCVIRRNL